MGGAWINFVLVSKDLWSMSKPLTRRTPNSRLIVGLFGVIIYYRSKHNTMFMLFLVPFNELFPEQLSMSAKTKRCSVVSITPSYKTH